MKGKVVFLIVAILMASLLLESLVFAGPFRPWRPTLHADLSASSIRVGESVTVTYSSEHATGAMRDWTQLRPFIGRSDGIVIPTQGSYSHTPTEVGTFTTRLTATRRAVNLNHNGKQEGWRRAVIIEFTVEVLRPGEQPRYLGSKTVYRTTRSWLMSNGSAWESRRQAQPDRHGVRPYRR